MVAVKTVKGKLVISRCLEEDMPVLLPGELCHATDTNKLYIGDSDLGNRVIVSSVSDEMKDLIDRLEITSEDQQILVNELKEKITILEEDVEWLKENGGGGFGGSGAVVTLTPTTESSLLTSLGQETLLEYNYTTSTNTYGKAIYTINSAQVANVMINPGDIVFDIGPYLVPGTNEVYIEVTDRYGGSAFLSFSINAVDLYLTSSFDSSIIYTDEITFNFTPNGTVEKTVHFEVDGSEVGTLLTRAYGTQLVYKIPKQSHGCHILRVYVTTTINETLITSNILLYEIICVEAGNDTPIIASTFRTETVEQYTAIRIPYLVYDPTTTNATVVLSNNGATSTINVDRAWKNWVISESPVGENEFTISCGTVSRSFLVDVTHVELNITETTQSLAVYLTSKNKSNESTDKDSWENSGIISTLNDFNYVSNGWIEDKDGAMALTIKEGASVEIGITPFAEDYKLLGKTIEIEFSISDILDYEDVVISCYESNIGFYITPIKAVYQTSEVSIQTKFKEDERMRLSFVVEGTNENRIMYTYLDGIISGLTQYSITDIFKQKNPVNITMGSDKCTLRVYNIRIYDRKLSDIEILNNFMYDLSDLEIKRKKSIQNNILDEYGDIIYSRLSEQLPCMTIVGSLPLVKGSKVTSDIVYENKANPARSFEYDDCVIDIQGTSSQYYPKKNYKIKLPEIYSLRENSVPVRVFTIKANYMESSGTHNTGMALFANSMYTEKVPPQEINSNIRTTIDGFNIALFHKKDASSPARFVGLYDFNNDKGTPETFGYSGDNCECWELCNNTSDRVLFKKSEYESLDANGKPDWLNDFEARYPEDNTDYTALKRLTDWLVATKDDTTTFKEEFTQYFNTHYVLMYYLISEFFAMVDSRAKNLFLATWDKTIFYPVFYDMDTLLGLNNEGVLEFDYDVEDEDTIGTLNVFNGKESVLWRSVKNAFATEIADLYRSLRTNKQLTYESVLAIFYNEQLEDICEAQYNADAKYKYLDPLLADNISTYLYIAQGSRVNHMKYWVYNRFKYMDSKYNAESYKDKYATFRLYTPSSWSGVEPNADFVITPFTSQYIGVKYGSYELYTRTTANTPTTINAPEMTFNDTETIVYGADTILSLGDLSNKYAGTVDVSKATKISELILGSDKPGYVNTNLRSVSVGNNTLMRKIDVRNAPNLAGVLDLSNCTAIEEIYATGTSITSVSLSNTGSVQTMHLPASLTTLELINKPKLTTLNIEGCDNIKSLNLEKCALNELSLFSRCNNVEKVRMIDIDCVSTVMVMESLRKCNGMTPQGLECPIGESVSGKITLATCNEELLEEYRQEFPLVEFVMLSGGTTYEVKFLDGDGNVLWVDYVFEYTAAEYGSEEIPTKTPTEQYAYVWTGRWDRELNPITGNTTINAVFETKLREFRVRYLNPITGECVSEQYVEYGMVPEEPTMPPEINFWGEMPGPIYADKDYVGEYIPYPSDLSPFTFTDNSDGTCTVTIVNDSNVVYPPTLIIPFKYENKYVTKVASGYYTTNSTPPVYSDTITEVFIPNTVLSYTNYNSYNTGTNYYNNAGMFSRVTSLEKVTLSKNAPALPMSMFRHCESLKEVVNSQYIINIHDYAFYGCTLLESFKLDSCNSLASYVFYECTNLSDVGDTKLLTVIYGGTFYGCESLSNINLENVESISGSAFKNSGIVSLYIPKIKYLEFAFIFENCTKLESVYAPELVGIKSGARSTFKTCTSLTSISMPKLKSIEASEIFYDCSSLIEVSLPELIEITDGYVFYQCTNLETVSLPKLEVMCGINDSIGYNFARCSAIISITLPKLERMGPYTFYKCTSLETVDLPVLTSLLGGNQFNTCSNLLSVNAPELEIPDNITGRTLCYSCTNLISFNAPKLRAIPNHCFSLCSNIESIPCDNIEIIGYNAFSYCTNLKGINGDNVITIDDSAFRECTSLETIDLPVLKSLSGGNQFRGCSNLLSVNAPELEISGSIPGGYMCDSCTNLISFNAPKLRVIPNYCFSSCSTLESISCDNIETIGQYAFSHCTNFKGINGDNVKTIGQYAFYVCTSLETIDLPVLKSLSGGNQFRGCSNLLSVNAPELEISGSIPGGYMCDSCTNLISFNAPKLRVIPNYCFSSCSTLESISCDNIETIGQYAFSHCTNFKGINGDNVTTISQYAFYDCTSLETVSFPKATIVGESAFYGCIRLTVAELNSVSTIPTNCFSNCNNLRLLVLGSEEYPFTTVVNNSAIPNNDAVFATTTDGEAPTEYSGIYGVFVNKSYRLKYNSDEEYYYLQSEDDIYFAFYTNPDNHTDVVIPDDIDGLPIIGLACSSFKGHTMNSFQLPATITKLPAYSFYNTGMSEYYFENITYVGPYSVVRSSSTAMYYSVEIGNASVGVTYIASDAFLSYCNSLTIYTADQDALTGSPWGASSRATITFIDSAI